jgi:hypothetical protein
LLSDLPLFIDPFLLFNSTDPDYQKLHQDVIGYLDFLREKATGQILSDDALEAYFHFSEVKETWLGFSGIGNSGRGLGPRFAKALNRNFNLLFSHDSIGITHGRHLEKLCLIDSGIGRDNISDFTTNLIKEFLLNYTQDFAKQYLDQEVCINTNVPKVRFNYRTETWESRIFYLPVCGNEHVLLLV